MWHGDLHARYFDGEVGEIGLSVFVHGVAEMGCVAPVVPVNEVASCEGGEDGAGADGELGMPISHFSRKRRERD